MIHRGIGNTLADGPDRPVRAGWSGIVRRRRKSIMSMRSTATIAMMGFPAGPHGNRSKAGRLRPDARLDRVLLATGSVWREPLVIRRSGQRGQARIEFGPRPKAPARASMPAGCGECGSRSSMRNICVGQRAGGHNSAPSPAVRRGRPDRWPRISGWRTTYGSAISISTTSPGLMTSIRTWRIVFRRHPPRAVPTRYEGLTIERNIVWKVDRSGDSRISDQVSRARWFPSRFVVIRDNYLEDIGGDGNCPRGTDGAWSNIISSAAPRPARPGYNARHLAVEQRQYADPAQRCRPNPGGV